MFFMLAANLSECTLFVQVVTSENIVKAPNCFNLLCGFQDVPIFATNSMLHQFLLNQHLALRIFTKVSE